MKFGELFSGHNASASRKANVPEATGRKRFLVERKQPSGEVILYVYYPQAQLLIGEKNGELAEAFKDIFPDASSPRCDVNGPADDPEEGRCVMQLPRNAADGDVQALKKRITALPETRSEV